MSEPLVANSRLTVRRVARDRQVLVQCRPDQAVSIAERIGVLLPVDAALTHQRSNGWHVLNLAPGEWLLIESADAEALGSPQVGSACSLVEVSDRNLSLDIDGEDAALLLSGGCPLDFAILHPAACTRTVFGKASVMLWRRGTCWRLSYPRSFDNYVCRLIQAIAYDIEVLAA